MSDKGLRTRAVILDAAEQLVLARGFAATSLDDILKATKLTKGAFFHHFDGKAALARSLVERHAAEDHALFTSLAEAAERRTADPLESTLGFLKLFEEYVESLNDPRIGCIFAIYTYESVQLDASILAFVAASLRRWTDIYERKFEAVLARYSPKRPTTAHGLAEMIVAIIEGGFVLSRSYDDTKFIARQSRQFRQYLELLFEGGDRAAP